MTMNNNKEYYNAQEQAFADEVKWQVKPLMFADVRPETEDCWIICQRYDIIDTADFADITRVLAAANQHGTASIDMGVNWDGDIIVNITVT